MERKYADIIIDISHEKLDKTFQYVVPERLWEKVEAGTCVLVPFGKGNRLRKGYVASIGRQAAYAPEKLKEIADVEENAISAEERYIALAAWMKEQYGSTLIAALKTVLLSSESKKAGTEELQAPAGCRGGGRIAAKL